MRDHEENLPIEEFLIDDPIFLKWFKNLILTELIYQNYPSFDATRETIPEDLIDIKQSLRDDLISCKTGKGMAAIAKKYGINLSMLSSEIWEFINKMAEGDILNNLSKS